jgi:hypothetical protein
MSAHVEIHSKYCHHNKLPTLIAILLAAAAFINRCGVLNIYKRTTCEESTLIDIGDVIKLQVRKDLIRPNRLINSKCYHVYANFAKIGKLVIWKWHSLLIQLNRVFQIKYLKFPKNMFHVRLRLYKLTYFWVYLCLNGPG